MPVRPARNLSTPWAPVNGPCAHWHRRYAGCGAACVEYADGSKLEHLCGACLSARGSRAARSRWGRGPDPKRVAELRAHGLSIRQVAERLGVSHPNVLRTLHTLNGDGTCDPFTRST